MTTMYDAVDVAAIPADATLVAGYVDGSYITVPALEARFPQATVVEITVSGLPGVTVLDCESGDATPAQAAGWAHREIAADRRPTIYTSLDLWPEVLAQFGLGALELVDWWIADWTGLAHLVTGSVATQWASPDTGSGGDYDISMTNGVWPGHHVGPTPPAKGQTMLSPNAVTFDGFVMFAQVDPAGTLRVKGFQPSKGVALGTGYSGVPIVSVNGSQLNIVAELGPTRTPQLWAIAAGKDWAVPGNWGHVALSG